MAATHLIYIALFAWVIKGSLGRQLSQQESYFHVIETKGQALKPNAEGEQPLPHPPAPPKPQEHCVAVVETSDPNGVYLGSSAGLSVYQPKVQGAQWSAARIKLSNGADSLEAGWMVNPTIFQDDDAHLYVRFTAGQAGCINLQCTGFVQVPQGVPLGSKPDKYSVIGGEQHTMELYIEKHTDDGNWWLFIGKDKQNKVGYWPKSLFTSLADFGNHVEWGGEISDPGALDPIPQMGSGLFAEYDSFRAAYFARVSIVDQTFKSVIPPTTQKSASCLDLYTVKDAGYVGSELARLILYGGNGRQSLL